MRYASIRIERMYPRFRRLAYLTQLEATFRCPTLPRLPAGVREWLCGSSRACGRPSLPSLPSIGPRSYSLLLLDIAVRSARLHISRKHTTWRQFHSGATLAPTSTGPPAESLRSSGALSWAASDPSFWYDDFLLRVWVVPHEHGINHGIFQVAAPPIRAYFGDGPRPQIPHTYPSEYHIIAQIRQQSSDATYSSSERTEKGTRRIRRLKRRTVQCGRHHVRLLAAL